MKKNCISVLLISNIVFSQTSIDRKVRLDSLFIETFEDNYSYFRIAERYYEKLENYNIKDFYLSGNLLKEGIYKDKDAFVKNGKFTEYYENGYAKKELSYKENQPYGKMETWYENGNPKEVGYYSTILGKETIYNITDFWDIDNKTLVSNGTGEYSYDDKDEQSSGKVIEGLKQGKWVGVSKKHKLNFIEYYKNGEIIQGISTDENGIEYNYLNIEIKPEPKNGIYDFYKFIGQNFVVPNVIGLKGKIFIEFCIEIDGSIIKPKILRGIGHGADEEAIRVLKKYPLWKPGQIRGKKVRVTYQLPISMQVPN